MIKITDGVPIPEGGQQVRKGRKGDGRQGAVMALEIGESFFLKASINSAGVLRWWAKARNEDRDYAVKKEGNGVRIWRTK